MNNEELLALLETFVDGIVVDGSVDKRIVMMLLREVERETRHRAYQCRTIAMSSMEF